MAVNPRTVFKAIQKPRGGCAVPRFLECAKVRRCPNRSFFFRYAVCPVGWREACAFGGGRSGAARDGWGTRALSLTQGRKKRRARRRTPRCFRCFAATGSPSLANARSLSSAPRRSPFAPARGRRAFAAAAQIAETLRCVDANRFCCVSRGTPLSPLRRCTETLLSERTQTQRGRAFARFLLFGAA